MSILRDLVLHLTGIILISSATELLLSGDNVRKYARFACGLLLMLTLLDPLFRIISIDPQKEIAQILQNTNATTSIHSDQDLLERQIQSISASVGVELDATISLDTKGRIDRVALSVYSGDARQAKQAICAAFFIHDDQIEYH